MLDSDYVTGIAIVTKFLPGALCSHRSDLKGRRVLTTRAGNLGGSL